MAPGYKSGPGQSTRPSAHGSSGASRRLIHSEGQATTNGERSPPAPRDGALSRVLDERHDARDVMNLAACTRVPPRVTSATSRACTPLRTSTVTATGASHGCIVVGREQPPRVGRERYRQEAVPVSA